MSDLPQSFHNGRAILHAGDCLDVLKTLPDDHFDSVVTDPPYHLTSIVKRFGGANADSERYANGEGRSGFMSRGFMGKQWDGGDIAFRVELWREVLRVLKPGGHVVAFSGTRTFHRMASAIEDAGFEIRDMLQWLYGSGFPKSHDVSKGIDRMLGAEREKVRVDASLLNNPPNLVGGVVKGDDRPWRQKAIERGFHEKDSDGPASAAAAAWQGWGTALKPACEPICVARKPLREKTVAANVLAHGTGAINVDACRVDWQSEADAAAAAAAVGFAHSRANGKLNQSPSIGKESRDGTDNYHPEKIAGRWPANIIHDGSDEVVSAFPDTGISNGGGLKVSAGLPDSRAGGAFYSGNVGFGDSGSAARFFYSAKADAHDRIGSKHPTVKPVDLMRWLVRLVTPPGGLVLDPFAGTGTTGEACLRENFRCEMIEREEAYCEDIARRMALTFSGPGERARESLKARGRVDEVDALPLFGGGAA